MVMNPTPAVDCLWFLQGGHHDQILWPTLTIRHTGIISTPEREHDWISFRNLMMKYWDSVELPILTSSHLISSYSIWSCLYTCKITCVNPFESPCSFGQTQETYASVPRALWAEIVNLHGVTSASIHPMEVGITNIPLKVKWVVKRSCALTFNVFFCAGNCF